VRAPLAADMTVNFRDPTYFSKIQTQLEALPNVQGVERYGGTNATTRWGTLQTYGYEPETQLYHYQLTSGRWMRPRESNVILLSDAALAKTGLALGDAITLTNNFGATSEVALTIIGTVKQAIDVLGWIGAAVLPVDTLYRLKGVTSQGATQAASQIIIGARDRSQEAVNRLAAHVSATVNPAGASSDDPGYYSGANGTIDTIHEYVTRRQSDATLLYELLYALALARYRAGSPAAAIEPLRRAIERNDSVAQTHYLLGLVYRDTNKIDDAIDALQHAIKVSPSLTPAREELADLYRSRGQQAEEMAELRDLAALDRNDDRHIAIAMAATRRGQFDLALAALSEVSPTALDGPHVQLARGRIYLARAERTLDRQWARKAQDVLERALAGGDRRSEGLALYGRALFLMGDPRAAERTLRKAVTTAPIDPEAFDYLADACERLSHTVDARDALVSLDALEGDTADAGVRGARARRIGALSFQVNDAKRAADYLDQAVDAGDTDAATLGLLADAYWRSGSHDLAKTTLAKALQQDPRNAELLRLGRTIK